MKYGNYPKVTRFSKVRCRMDVRKLSLAFGVTHVVRGLCYLYEQKTSRLVVYSES